MIRTIVLLGIAGLVATSAVTAAQESVQAGQEQPQSPAADTAGLEEMRDQILSMVNKARKEHGLGTLKGGQSLDKAAQEHAEDMLDRGYYSHVSPEGETVEDRYREQGGSRWELVAENIATCKKCETPPTLDRVAQFQDGWMNSPEHRENLLKEGLERFGFGIAGSEGRIYAVQTFAGPGTPLDLAPGEEPVVLSADEQRQTAIQAFNRAREREELEPVEQSAALSEVARKLLPENGTADNLIDRPDDLFGLLPEGRESDWSRLQVVAAACGGCGTRPTAADIRYFADRWTNDPRDGRTVLRGNVSHMGFAMRANGKGRKVAVAVLGERR